jgi:hypothetical protein
MPTDARRAMLEPRIEACRPSRLLCATSAIIPRRGARSPADKDRLFVRRLSPN